MTELRVGDYARYVRTGTVGKVVDVKEREDGRWIQLDSTGLYYHEDYVEKVETREAFDHLLGRIFDSSTKTYLPTASTELHGTSTTSAFTC